MNAFSITHMLNRIVREILMGCIQYIKKRRPLEIEITFKQKIICSWEQSAMHILYVDRMLRTRGLSKVLQDSYAIEKAFKF